jgi:hypothetical protein
MKSKIYLVSVVAITLVTTVNAQTGGPVAEAGQPASASSENKRILTRLGGKTVPDDLSAETPLAVKTANISGESDRNELLKLAEALSYQARRLKNDATSKTGDEKNRLLADAAQFEKNCLLKQIEASEIFGAMSQVKFNANKETINKLIVTEKLEANKMSRTRALISSSEKNMQLAKDLREESYSSSNLAARLGRMSNAEEKEVLALGEQSQAINLLWKKPKSEM